VPPDEVVRLLDDLDTAGVRCWVDGGWGVDALLGRQTREHSDLDLVVDDGGLRRAIGLFEQEGYVVIRDWLPTAIAFRRESDGNEVDLHPVRITPDGGGDQTQLDGISVYHYEAPTPGLIGGRSVPCCSIDDQIRCHRGYEPTAKDRRDMAALAEAFGIALPAPYVGAE
jgi:lincosamide nucleotidyltransferase A/C/D/E